MRSRASPFANVAILMKWRYQMERSNKRDRGITSYRYDCKIFTPPNPAIDEIFVKADTVPEGTKMYCLFDSKMYLQTEM